MLIEKAQPSHHTPTPIIGSPTIAKMLIAKRYDQVDEMLAQAQYALRSTEDNTILNDILRAARQICLSCQVLHDTAEWHRWASQEARHQEQDLSQLLQLISDLIYADNLWTLPKSASNDNTSPNFWRRIQNALLGHSPETLPLTPPTELLLHPNSSYIAPKQPISGFNSADAPTDAIPDTETLPAVEVTPPSSSPTVELDDIPAVEVQHLHPTFVIYGLGYFHLYHNEELIDNWSHRKAKTLFKYLLWHRHRPVSKEVLMDLFWPETDADAARNNLNVTIYNLRQILRQSDASCSYILFQNDSYVLNPDLKIWIDYEAFLDHFQQAKHLANDGHHERALYEMQSAASLYQGQLFEDDPYDDWIAPQRQALHNHYVEILDYLSRHAFVERDYATCITVCNKQLIVDSCREDAHRRLMECYVALGQHYLAMRQYHTCVEQLKLNLDVLPSPQTVELYEGIHAAL